jgi:hypothetical protein
MVPLFIAGETGSMLLDNPLNNFEQGQRDVS